MCANAGPLRGCSGVTGKLGRVKSTRSAWTIYIVLRLLFFVVPFALVYWLGLQLQFSLALSGGVAAVLAALISMSLSIIFLARPRAQAAQSIVEWRNRDRTADDIAEDAVLDDEGSAEAVPSTQAEPAAQVEPVQTEPAEQAERTDRA